MVSLGFLLTQQSPALFGSALSLVESSFAQGLAVHLWLCSLFYSFYSIVSVVTRIVLGRRNANREKEFGCIGWELCVVS